MTSSCPSATARRAPRRRARRAASWSSAAASPASPPPRSSPRAATASTCWRRTTTLGGRVGSVERDGFRFDTGASWYLMPEVFEHFFELLGTTAEAELDLTVLDPSYRVFFEGHDEPARPAPRPGPQPGAVRVRRARAPARAFDAYLASAEDTYDLALRRFLYSNFDSTVVASCAPTSCAARPRLGPAADPLAGQPRRRRGSPTTGCARCWATPRCSSARRPTRAPSLYHLMSRLDLGDRVLYPQGGFTRLIEAIAAARRAPRRAAAHRRRRSPGSSPTPTGRGRPARDRRRAHDGGRRASYARRPTSSSAPPTCTTSRPPCSRATCRPIPSRRGGGAPPVPGAVLAHARRRGPPARARPPLAVLHLRLGPELRRHLRRRARGSRTRPRSTSASRRRPTPAWRPRAARTSSSWSRCRPTSRSARGGDDGARLGGGRADRRRGHRPGGRVGRRSPTCASASGCATPSDRRTSSDATTPGAAARSASSTPCARARSCARATCRRKVDGLLYAGASTVPGVGLPMCLISAELVLKRLTGDRSLAPGGPDEPAALVLRRHARLLPGRDAAAGRRSSGCGCCGSRGGCCSPSSPPGTPFLLWDLVRHPRRALALRRRPDPAVAGGRAPARGDRLLRRHPARLGADLRGGPGPVGRRAHATRRRPDDLHGARRGRRAGGGRRSTAGSRAPG